jgi:D-aminopeptidase
MPRSRDLGIVFGDAAPGERDAITDVAGVRVGSVTLVEGEAVRTGVTVIVPSQADVGAEQLFAGCHTLNGNGELTGLEWVRESGRLTTPIALTNTHSVGTVRDALAAHSVRARGYDDFYWALPVVGETWDGMLNDINGAHVRPEHLGEAIAKASGGAVEEGAVGGGTGMICHGFKGGIGTASRVTPEQHGGYTVGVLVQANHGSRERLTVAGAPVGRVIGHDVVPDPYEDLPESAAAAGSIIVIVATDAPLLPHQCRRLAQRASLGIARTGGAGEHSSGDILLAFSTAAGLAAERGRGRQRAGHRADHDVRGLAHRAALPRDDRGHRGRDRQCAAGRRDDHRPPRRDGLRPRARAAARGDAAALSADLRHVYWLGGGSGAGKSTVARRVAAEHGLRLYATDEAMADHAARSTPEDSPALHEFMAMDMRERWSDRSPEVMLETFHWYRGEGFGLIVEDLVRLGNERGVIAEGFRLLPRLVEPLAAPGRAVWLLPTPGFRRAAFEGRGSWWTGNLLERDRLFTERLREETAQLGLPAIEVETSMTEEDLAERVARAFAL